jgi:hypothetical protein
MDLRTYFQLFWVPAVASAALMALLWAQGGLSGRAPLFLASWFVLALAAQYFGTTTSVVWVAGLASQTALAIFMLLRHQLGQLYNDKSPLPERCLTPLGAQPTDQRESPDGQAAIRR